MAIAITSSSSPAYIAKPPPPPPGLHKMKTTVRYDDSYNGHGHATTVTSASESSSDERRALDGMVLALRAAAALLAFVGVALVASCRHGDWMEFARYHEYRYLLGASVVACLYSAAQAALRRRRSARGLLDLAGDQLVAYLLITAASAALPITIRMRSAVINIFTDAMVAAIGMALGAFAALALSAIISGFSIASSSTSYY